MNLLHVWRWYLCVVGFNFRIAFAGLAFALLWSILDLSFSCLALRTIHLLVICFCFGFGFGFKSSMSDFQLWCISMKSVVHLILWLFSSYRGTINVTLWLALSFWFALLALFGSVLLICMLFCVGCISLSFSCRWCVTNSKALVESLCCFLVYDGMINVKALVESRVWWCD